MSSNVPSSSDKSFIKQKFQWHKVDNNTRMSTCFNNSLFFISGSRPYQWRTRMLRGNCPNVKSRENPALYSVLTYCICSIYQMCPYKRILRSFQNSIYMNKHTLPSCPAAECFKPVLSNQSLRRQEILFSRLVIAKCWSKVLQNTFDLRYANSPVFKIVILSIFGWQLETGLTLL